VDLGLADKVNEIAIEETPIDAEEFKNSVIARFRNHGQSTSAETDSNRIIALTKALNLASKNFSGKE
jgi:hypothetical protein